MRPIWITFYSVRGGVGRSTLLALCALDLAHRGRRVAVIDFDLEAPGLDILLTPADAPSTDLVRAGVVDYLAARSEGTSVALEDIILPRELPGDYKGRLFLVPAGRCDEPYLAHLDRLDFPRFYERPGLLNPVRALRADIDEHLAPDVVLVDSRTGYSDTALFTLFDLADAVVTVVIPDSQNIERLAPILRRLTDGGSQRRPSLFLAANKCHGSPAGMRAVADAEDRLRALVPVDQEDLPDEEETPFLHKISFDSSYLSMQRLLPPPALSDSQRKLSGGLHQLVDELGASTEAEVVPVDKPSTRKATPKATDQVSDHSRILECLGEAWKDLREADHAEKDTALLRAFFFASRVVEALRPDRPLIRGRKGAGKSAIFRLLTEEPAEAVKQCPELRGVTILPGHGQQQKGTGAPHYLSVADFRIVADLVKEDAAWWNDLFRLYAVAQITRSVPALATNERRREAAGLLDDPDASDHVERLRRLLHEGAHRWQSELRSLAEEPGPPLMLIYDHLDAGFGSGSRAFDIRRDAVTGLLDAWGEDAELLGNRIRPKILLREDVFGSLTLANVNRWRTRDVELRWDFPELIKCLSKRAKLDPQLQEYLAKHADPRIRELGPDVAEFVVLFDERVRPREKQARTWLTVQNRLADALGNRFPRDFLRFGVEALKLEVEAPGARRHFAPAIIAGTHARAALPKVSERRATDLRDEFPDYIALLARMAGLSSPFDADELVTRFAETLAGEKPLSEKEQEAGTAISRLKEYGVIGDWNVEGLKARLFVPDLYLWGLGMSRHGW